jgi:K+ transporter
VIILALFAAQRVGTARVGRLFGPVMTVWFLTIATAGIGGIVAEPEIPGPRKPESITETPSGSSAMANILQVG